MKRLVWAVLVLSSLAPLTAWAQAGHGLADGHEWFHALLPFAGALLIIMARLVCRRVLAKVRRSVSR